MSNFIYKYRLWKRHKNLISWGEFIDLTCNENPMGRWCKDWDYDCGINSAYVGQKFNSIHLNSYLFWRLCGAKPIVVKQFGKEVTLDAEYYVKKLEKRLRLQWAKSRKEAMEALLKADKNNSATITRDHKGLSFLDRRDEAFRRKMPRIIPLQEDPGQLNIMINFAHEERSRKPNEWGAKPLMWDIDFHRSMIKLQEKADKAMDKEYVMLKLADELRKNNV